MTQDPFYTSSSAAYPEAPSSKKKRSPWVVVLIVLGIVLLCCCVIGVAGWFLGDPLLELLNEMGFDLSLYLALL